MITVRVGDGVEFWAGLPENNPVTRAEKAEARNADLAAALRSIEQRISLWRNNNDDHANNALLDVEAKAQAALL